MRQVAVPVWIAELIAGEYEEKEGWEPNILRCGRGDISRCNIIGTFLEVNGERMLDDGTGQVMLRNFDPVPGLETCAPGTIVQMIGRPRFYNQQLTIIMEIIRPVHQTWALLRKNHLGRVQPYNRQVIIKEPEPQPKPENNAEHIIQVIASLDTGDGANIDEVIAESQVKDIAEEIINQLLLDGEIFEIKPGMIKVL